MSCDLNQKKCVPCEGGVPPLTEQESKKLLKEIPGWNINDTNKEISRKFDFKGFNQVMGFVNAIAWIANTEGHHPDVSYGYNYCEITFSTHAIDGLCENDFICASKVNGLFG
jgi:4a-hydroxytetrahydrobiopterin dehydratase